MGSSACLDVHLKCSVAPSVMTPAKGLGCAAPCERWVAVQLRGSVRAKGWGSCGEEGTVCWLRKNRRFPPSNWKMQHTNVAERGKSLTVMRASDSETDENGSEEETEKSGENPKVPLTISKVGPLWGSPDFWLQVAIVVFTAGFIDAGFSGDWSRIGVLSREIEGDIQIATVGVVPLAGILIWSIFKRRQNFAAVVEVQVSRMIASVFSDAEDDGLVRRVVVYKRNGQGSSKEGSNR